MAIFDKAIFTDIQSRMPKEDLNEGAGISS